ncbi:hypothetical protein D9758_003035 [Tetrapyrgos nigripes]|uniref:Uncharacterized protein n=1 Tax=Tetrapyrgos nigripes TaxID=182062 RepID=A0A8H5LSX7_9AGAR|nr:hypothetical protein D9758_003035 [Tetrapyrgos nigripes]
MSSSVTVTLPKEFAFVGAALLSTAWLLFWQTNVVSSARKKADVPYPQLYAEKSETSSSSPSGFDKLRFNCAQRAHQNTLEALPGIYLATLTTGFLGYPVFAASACGFWVFTRVLYTRGYATGDPKRVRCSVFPYA